MMENPSAWGRVAIVDDDKIIRGHIRGILLSLGYTADSIDEAYDGLSGLTLLRRQQPAIVLTDMRMPHMDGVEMIRAARAEFSWMQFIVLSNYDDFDYVRSSFQYNIVDYLLKYKLDTRQVETVLQKAHENLNSYRNEGQRDARLRLMSQADECLQRGQALLENGRSEVLPPLIRNQPVKLCLLHLVKPARQDEAAADMQRDALSSTALRFGDWKSELLTTWLDAFEKDNADDLSLFAYAPEERPAHFILGVLSCKKYINPVAQRAWLKDRVNPIFTLAKRKKIIGLCVEREAWCYSAELVRQALRQSEDVFYSVDCGELPEDKGNSSVAYDGDSTSVITRFHSACLAGNAADACAILDEYERQLRARRPNPEEARSVLWQLYSCTLGEQPSATRELENVSQAAQTLATFCEELRRAVSLCCTEGTRQADKESSAIDRLIRQVTDNLFLCSEGTNAEDGCQTVTLEQAAKLTGYSRTHFCRVFKQHTGESFNVWLTNIRIERARQLLSAPNADVRAVSSAVGISDVRYFRKLFFSHTGESVEAYMRRNGRFPIRGKPK